MSEPALCTELLEGILLVSKPQGKTSFSLIRALRRLTGIQKIGHAGTLDPFATGVMVCLIGKRYTRLSDKLLSSDKEYLADVYLGVTTDTYDCDGKIVASSKRKPHLESIEKVIGEFQGEIEQIPPMFSAKKIEGKKLYELAREGKSIERSPAKVSVSIELIAYEYPRLQLKVACSKGTYIRSLAHDMGERLGCGAHLCQLKRTRSGSFNLDQCLDGQLLFSEHAPSIQPYLLTESDLNL
jgi:tRNA pseudouridine55 synthase